MFEVNSTYGIQKLESMYYDNTYLCVEGRDKGKIFRSTDNNSPGFMDPEDFIPPEVVDAFEDRGIELINQIIYFEPLTLQGDDLVIDPRGDVLWVYELSVDGNLVGEGPVMARVWDKAMNEHYRPAVAYATNGDVHVNPVWKCGNWRMHGPELWTDDSGLLDWNEIDWMKTVSGEFVSNSLGGDE